MDCWDKEILLGPSRSKGRDTTLADASKLSREPRERREPRESREPRERREPRESREPRERREPRESREPREREEAEPRRRDRKRIDTVSEELGPEQRRELPNESEEKRGREEESRIREQGLSIQLRDEHQRRETVDEEKKGSGMSDHIMKVLLPKVAPRGMHMSRSLYIDNLPEDATEREVRHIFVFLPGFENVHFVDRSKDQPHYRACFVEFCGEYEAYFAWLMRGEYMLNGKERLHIQFSRRRERRN
eukprot:TRINITY_DN474_c0_g1_i1.p1 TRINITY_DN474_c0_g1~~TRINITY_DN474_c0_g1_i1.p1  ORF type:complete len:249 (+),score=61.25 TRINITY_DN474_c0_g1_i1:66-812(+)